MSESLAFKICLFEVNLLYFEQKFGTMSLGGREFYSKVNICYSTICCEKDAKCNIPSKSVW